MSLKLFAKDAMVYALGNVGLRAAALMLTPVYTYCLSMNDYGLWATIQVTIQMMLILMSMGMREGFVRFTRDCEETNTVGRLLGASTVVVLVSGACVTLLSATLLMPLFRQYVMQRDDAETLVVLMCLAALAQALCIQIMSYYRANNQARRYMVVGFSGALLMFVLTFVSAYVFKRGVQGVLWAYLMTYVVMCVAVALDILPKTGFGFSRELMRTLLGFGSPLVVSAAGQFTMNVASIYLLKFFAGNEAVAIYSLGWKFSTLMSIGISLPFQLAFQPFVFGNLKSPDIKRQSGQLLTYLLLATTFTAFILIVGAKILLPWVAPPSYSSAYLVIILLMPGQAFMGIHYYGETLLGAVRRTRILGVLNTVSAALCTGLNVLCIPFMGWYGAVLASNVTAILVDSIEVAIGLKEFELSRHVEWGRVVIVGMVFVAQLAVTLILRDAAAPLFFAGTGAFFLVAVAFLYFGPFCSSHEKTALRGAAGRIGSLITARVSAP